MSLAYIDKKLTTFYVLEKFGIRKLSTQSKDTKIQPFDASQWDKSKELCCIFLWSLDDEIMLLTFILKVTIFW